MNFDTFRALTLQDLEKSFSYWQKGKEREERSRWEIMRMQVSLMLQPFVKGDLDPKKICPLPWDKSRHQELTDEERKRQNERVTRYLKTGHWD